MRIAFPIILFCLFTACISKKLPQQINRQVEAIPVNANNDTNAVYKILTDSSGLRDIDGNYYKIIPIGSQVWIAENLRVTRFMDGTPIAFAPDSAIWKNLRSAAYCWVNNDSATYASPYGALYNWYAVNTGKLCPSGWHVPSNTDWDILTSHLGGTAKAGGKLKEADTIHWNKPNLGATNESGFTAIPAGGRSDDGIFGNFGQNNILWSTTEFDARFAWFRSISYYY